MSEYDTMSETENQKLLVELEPEANEIVFGEKTLPNRPLTEKEISRKKRVVLKLFDQRLKFKLIELMSKVDEQNKISQIPTTDKSRVVESNCVNNTIAPTLVYQSLQSVYPDSLNHNWQTQFQTEWISPTYYQNHTASSGVPMSLQEYSCQQNQQWGHSPQNFDTKVLAKRKREPNNLVHPVMKPTPNNKSTDNHLSDARKTLGVDGTKFLPKKSCNNITAFHSSSFSVNTSHSKSVSHFNRSTTTRQSLTAPSKICSKYRKTRSTNNSQFSEDDHLDNAKDWLHQSKDPIEQLTNIPKSNQMHNSINTGIQKESTSNDLQRRQSMKRKQKRLPSYVRRKLLRQNIFNSGKANIQFRGESDTNTGSSATYDAGVEVDTSEASLSTEGDDKMNTTVPTDVVDMQSFSVEWNRMDQLVIVMCRNLLNLLEPLSPYALKLKNEIFLQMSINPDAIRSNPIFAQRAGHEELENLIHECKVILSTIRNGDPETQSNFCAARQNLINYLKTSNDHCLTKHEARSIQNVKNNIKNIINPLFSVNSSKFNESYMNEFVDELIKNPHALEDNEILNGNKNEVMRSIKNILETFIPVREAKKFYLPPSRFVDVPFVVKLYDKSGKMTEENAAVLRKVLVHSIDVMHTQPKPKIIDVEFRVDSLFMVCVNRMTFDWVTETISEDFNGKWPEAHLDVEICPVKNDIPKNGLKTICLKFEHPQFFHFNDLMVQLKKDNPRLLTRRWELRTTVFKSIDPTKCLHAGVDIESLAVLEEMNRVGVLRTSLVYFEISYKDNEGNFGTTQVNKKTQ